LPDKSLISERRGFPNESLSSCAVCLCLSRIVVKKKGGGENWLFDTFVVTFGSSISILIPEKNFM
jgi:hypothetical protein